MNYFINKRERANLKSREQYWSYRKNKKRGFVCECGADSADEIPIIRPGLAECSRCKTRFIIRDTHKGE